VNLNAPTLQFMRVVWSGKYRTVPSVKGDFTLMDGTVTSVSAPHDPVAVDTYYISPDKCTECQGFHEEPQCAAVCPVDCCVPDEMYQETVEELLGKQSRLHV
jgi:ferredoxin